MGYATTYYGDLEIDPPVTDEERKAHPDINRLGGAESEFSFWPYWVTEDGTKITAAEDPTGWDESPLQLLVDLLRELNPARQFRGYTYGEGDALGDYWRAHVTDQGKVIVEVVVMTWPDGTKVKVDIPGH